MLGHLPSIPLFINYWDTPVTITQLDELEIHHAPLLHDCIHHIDLYLPSSILHKFLELMDEPFSMLEHLSLLSTTKEDTNVVLLKTFLAPNIHHLTCSALIF